MIAWPLVLVALLVANSGSEGDSTHPTAVAVVRYGGRPSVTTTSDRRSQPDVDPSYFWMPEDFVTEGGAHVTFRATSDGQYVIVWCTSEFTREFGARGPHGRGHYPWLAAENERVLILQAAGGTNTWYAFVLPLNETDEPECFYAPVVYDMERDLLVHLHGSADTLLAVRNVATGAVQWVTGPECEVPCISMCVDSVRIVGDEILMRFRHFDEAGGDPWCEDLSEKLDVERLVE